MTAQADGQLAAVNRRTPYIETFDDGCGGWYAWKPNGMAMPEVRNGVYHERSPWWVDSNHAPPHGAGYLHLLAILWTHREAVPEHCWPNRFVEGGFSRDLTGARLTLRVRGEVSFGTAKLSLLVQAHALNATSNYVLTGDAFEVTPEWSDASIVLAPDPQLWTCVDAREDLTDRYGCTDVAEVLRDVDVDMILVLFPLPVRSVAPIAELLHGFRPQREFDVDWASLPTGRVEIDTIRLDYPIRDT
jgi:hypothetical protein